MMKYISSTLLVLVITSVAHAVPLGAVKDLTTPVVGTGLPTAGSRVRVTLPEYAGTNVYHALYLPTDWEPGKQYPVIVEYAGNEVGGDPGSGTVEAMDMGYGISGGEGFIWVSMPFVSENHQYNEVTWWGDVGASVAYTKETVASIINEYGGDPDALFLSGFSRGAIGVNYIGLYDDEIASLWRGFHIHDHYDGQKNWPWTGGTLEQYRAEALVRLGRIKGRQQYITSQPASTSDLIDYINTINPTPNVDFILGSIGNGWGHTDEWALYDTPERNAVRAWMQGLASSEPTIPSLLINGKFETGDLTGWVNTASATIDSTTPLAGSHSALLPNDLGAGSPQNLSQTFPAQTDPITVRFTFSMPDPGVRGLQVYLGETGAGQINLQVVDLDDDGDGDVQIYSTNLGSFQTVLTDAVTFDTPQTFSLTFNGFGRSFGYDLRVGSQSATGLSFWQNRPLNDFNELAFVNEFGNTSYEIDNAFVGAIPEPSSAVLLMLVSGLGLAGRQRRA